MARNGQLLEPGADAQVLHWTGRVFSAGDLRQELNGRRELVLPAKAIVTPLAAEELRRLGVKITRTTPERLPAGSAVWGYVQDVPYEAVRNAVRSLCRDGAGLIELAIAGEWSPCQWARAVAACIADGKCMGGVAFCRDPGLVCCVANKIRGLRAATAANSGQVQNALAGLGANLIAVEAAGRTFAEIRQILRVAGSGGTPACPDAVASLLKELDGHAHR